MPEWRQISVRLAPETHAGLAEEAVRAGIGVSTLAAQIISEAVPAVLPDPIPGQITVEEAVAAHTGLIADLQNPAGEVFGIKIAEDESLPPGVTVVTKGKPYADDCPGRAYHAVLNYCSICGGTR